MPRVTVVSADGFGYQIATRQTETLLRAWFDEILPWACINGRPGQDDFEVIWPQVQLFPLWAWRYGPPSDPDWLTDSRVLGRLMELRARDGETALKELLRIRQELEAELREMRP